MNGTGVSSDGALRNISGNNTYAGAITLASDSRINSDLNLLTIDVAAGNAISGTFNLTIGGAGNVTIADPIAIGTGTLTKDGAGNLTFSGGAGTANTYTGVTTVNGGTLTLSKNAGVTSIAGDLIIGDGSGTDTVTVTASNQIADTSAVTINLGGVLGLNTSITDTIGSLTMTGGSVTLGASAILTLGGDVVGNASGTSATISGSTGQLNLGGVVRTFTIADGAVTDDMLISAIVSNGSVTKEGAGTLTLSGANTYTGAVLINAGTLKIGSATGLGTTAGGATVADGAVLDLNGHDGRSRSVDAQRRGHWRRRGVDQQQRHRRRV